MRSVSTLLTTLCLLGATSAAAQGTGRETSLRFDAAYEHLSNGFSPWRTAGVMLETLDGGSVFQAGVKESLRYSRLDHELTAGFQQTLISRLIAVGEAEVSPTHHVAAHWAALGRLDVRVADGWNVQGSIQHREYEAASVGITSMTVERYLGRYRAAYTVYWARLDSVDTALTHRAQGNWYYGRTTSSIGISVSAGEELENVQPLGILRTRVRSVALTGRQWLTPAWFVAYDTLVHEQGSLYQRRRLGVSLGHRF
jgi:YaiO family outer membrane protein